MMFLLHPDDSLSGSGLWGRKGPKNRPFRGCQEVRGAGEAVCARASDATASHGARTVDLAVHPRIGEEPKKKVLHPTPGRVSCFLSDRVPRRDLTGPARPARLRGNCPPASACGGCLLLDFAPKAYRPRRAVGSQASRHATSRLCACGPPLKPERGGEVTWGSNPGGGRGRRHTGGR